MLSRLPALSGLLGDEAKLTFRNHNNGVSKLWLNRNIPESDTYWNQYSTLFDSSQDVFTLILPHDIRRALQEAPENIATLIKVISGRLFILVSDHTFPTATNASFFTPSILHHGDRHTTKEVLNCIRVLSRVLPVVFELDNSPSKFEMDIFWAIKEPKSANESTTSEGQFVIADDNEEEENEQIRTGTTTSSQRPLSTPATDKTSLQESLAARLLTCLIDLLFCCGFTAPKSLQVDHHKINYTIWEPGIGSSTDTGKNTMYDGNKTEVLRLLLVLFSRQIYTTPSLLLSTPSLFTIHFVQRTPRRLVLAILCSLLNTAFSGAMVHSNTIEGIAERLPYKHLVFKGDDSRIGLVSIGLQVLCAVVDFQSGSAKDRPPTGLDESTAIPTFRTNAFRYFLAKLHRQPDFNILIKGSTTIIQVHLDALQNLLPGSRRLVPHIFECIVLLWRMIEINSRFRAYFVESEAGLQLFIQLLLLNTQLNKTSQQHGLCRILSYIIQTLSAEPGFGAKIAAQGSFILDVPHEPTTTFADILILNICSTLMPLNGPLNTAFPGLVVALANAAAHFRELDVASSVRLLRLFKAYCDPVFLLSDEGNPRFLFFMLEAMNSMVTHHMSENPHVVYGILAEHRRIEFLSQFTLNSALREIRFRQASQHGENQTAHNTIGKGKRRESETPNNMTRNEKSDVSIYDRTQGGYPSFDSLGEEHELQFTMSPPSTRTASVSGLDNIQVGKGDVKADTETDISLDEIMAQLTTLGKGNFIPTDDWVLSWQKRLPLDILFTLISELLPKLRSIQRSRPKSDVLSASVDLLSHATLSNMTPAHSFVPRPFVGSDSSSVWLSSLIWGEIYSRSVMPIGPLAMTNVRLFQVKQAAVPGRSLPVVGAVTQVVGGLIGRTSDTQSERRI